MTRSESAPIAPISVFTLTHAHNPVIPAIGAIGAIRRSQTFAMSRLAVTPASEEQNAAYRAGLCIDCRTVRYSPGRPRCNHCHAIRIGRYVTASGDA